MNICATNKINFSVAIHGFLATQWVSGVDGATIVHYLNPDFMTFDLTFRKIDFLKVLTNYSTWFTVLHTYAYLCI